MGPRVVTDRVRARRESSGRTAGTAALANRPAPVEAPIGHLIRPPTADLEPFAAGLREGRLVLRRCEACSRLRYPLGPVCPRCGSTTGSWSDVDGRGRVHSWIRYRRSFIPEFEPLVPYVVVSAAIADGAVRIFGRLVGATEPQVSTGMPVVAVVERWADDSHVLAFEPSSDAGAPEEER